MSMNDDQRQKLDLIAQKLSEEAPSLAKALSEMHRPPLGLRPVPFGISGIQGLFLFVSVLAFGVATIGMGSVTGSVPLLVAGTLISAFGPITTLWVE